MNNFEVFGSNLPEKMDLGLKIQKTNIGIRISILDIPCVPIFRQNGQVLFSQPKFGKTAQLHAIFLF